MPLDTDIPPDGADERPIRVSIVDDDPFALRMLRSYLDSSPRIEMLNTFCFLPLSQNLNIDKRYGTRHRAALGLSEETDAIVVVVSEETQTISIARNGRINPVPDETQLLAILDIYKLLIRA